MPPEVLNRNYNEKCDLWSSGILLYFMVTGTMPFEAANDIMLSDLIRRGTFQTPSNVSSNCASLIAALLQKNPAERLSAAEALGHPWFTPPPCCYPAGSLKMGRLERFLGMSQQQKLVVAYVAAHTADSELVKESGQFFRVNKSRTGMLSREEVERLVGERNARAFDEINIGRCSGISYSSTVTNK
eukprot:TRINITY_DN10424_c0_g1_i13.p1 TRINITY_DN10424_c0_g1~~TRINITY_DN10424_c0_g1_i13.p1  ORF type:complete len:186 (-),score=31.65 TRINITY_DN10424_c0_g1_i13:381-938(-)